MTKLNPLSAVAPAFILAQKLWSDVEVQNHHQYYKSCWIFKGRINEFGHGYLSHRGKTYPAHKLAYELAHEKKLPAGVVVRHRCILYQEGGNNPACCNPFHLLEGTQQENSFDAFLDGTSARGETHGMSILTLDQVKDMKALARQHGEIHGLARAIANAMGLTPYLVERVLSGASWKHVEDDGRTCSLKLDFKYKTQSDEKKAAVSGENSGKATITEETVRNVLALARQHGTGRGLPPAIAKAVGITTNQAHQIISRHTWAHVVDDGRTCDLPVTVIQWERRDNPNQLVTEEQVRDIKALARQHPGHGVSRRIATVFDLPLHVVQHILSGKNWSHIPDDGRTCPIELPVRGPNKKHSAVLPPLNEPAPSATLP